MLGIKDDRKIIFTILPVLLFININNTFISLTNNRALAATFLQSNNNSMTTIIIHGGNDNDKTDSAGNPIIHATSSGGHNLVKFDSSMNGKTAELPVNTLIYLQFPEGKYDIKITPNKGVVEIPEQHGIPPSVPNGYIGLLHVVGNGTAKITVSKINNSPSKPLGAYFTDNRWSGYIHTSTTADVTGDWIVPTAGASPSASYTYQWVGVDGTGGNTNLLQIGTAISYDPNASPSAGYFAWYDNLPTTSGGAVVVNSGCTPTVSNCGDVSPGDSMSGEVKQISGTSWTITIEDITQNWTYTSSQTYGTSGTTGATNEWVVEAPTQAITPYGSVTFTNDTLNGSNPNHTYSTDSWDLAEDGITLSTASQPNSTKDGFTMYYCDPTMVCSSGWENISPSGSTNDQINAMSASTPTNVWAVGKETSTSPQSPVTYNYNGTSWTKIKPSNVSSLFNELLGVTSNSSGNAWAVGDDEQSNTQTLVYFWNGSSWVHDTSDNPSTSFTNQLNAVSMDSSGDSYAAGYYSSTGSNQLPLIEQWNGTKFAQVTISTPTGCTGASLSGISVLSSTNVWAVGSGSCGGVGVYVIYHYDGTSWTSTVGSTTTTTLASIKAISANEAWAVGRKLVSSKWVPFIMHYTSAGGWQEDTSYSFSVTSSSFLYSVDADSSNDVWIVGTLNGSIITLHYDGSSWSQISLPSISSPVQLNGIAVNSGTAWAGGISNNSTSPLPLILKSF